MRQKWWMAIGLSLIGVGLAGCARVMSIETEKPLPVMTKNANPAVMLAPVKGAPSKPADTELASFAAG